VLAVESHCHNHRLIITALADRAWIRDITGALTIPALVQYLHLKERVNGVLLGSGTCNRTVWKWTSSGMYSASSAYAAFFHGQIALCGAKEVWRMKALRQHNFFLWLIIQDRCWTSDRCQRHGLSNCEPCALYSQATETIHHLLAGCVFSREVCLKALCCFRWQIHTQTQNVVFTDWWLRSRRRSPGPGAVLLARL
jgi:hypothetical protein